MIQKLRVAIVKFQLIFSCMAGIPVFDDYQDHNTMLYYMRAFVQENSDLMTIYSIGQSVLRRELSVVEITAAKSAELLPNIKIIGNIHGNEPIGREISWELLKFLVQEYRNGNPKIKWLLNSTKIHLLPCMNPDGFETALKDYRRYTNFNDTCNTRGRTNERLIDLNRNFPGVFRVNSCPQQPESKAIIKWMNEIPFVLSLSLHSGSLLVNYPFDDTFEVDVTGLSSSPTPDDDVFRALASTYAKAHDTMHQMTSSCNGPTHGFENGITNGAMWYPINGGMQDYNYVHHGCMELTVELACCKFPRFSDVQMYWHQNLEAILSWVNFAHRGVKGTLRDICKGSSVGMARLMIKGRNSFFWSSKKGEFWRPLLTGNYQLQIQADGYEEKVVPFTVLNAELNKTHNIRPTILSIDLIPLNREENLKNNCSFFLKDLPDTRTNEFTILKNLNEYEKRTKLLSSNTKTTEEVVADVPEPDTASSNSNFFQEEDILTSTDVAEYTTINFRAEASMNSANCLTLRLTYFLNVLVVYRIFSSIILLSSSWGMERTQIL